MVKEKKCSYMDAVVLYCEELEIDPVPTEQTELETELTDLYLTDFSVFQSILDHWAIGQVFPVLPLDRLDEEPKRRGQVVDLTCDSDGKIDQYVSSNANKASLPLHDYRQGEPYYLGVFLVGAYQEILGDAHNLLGRVGEAHIYASADEPGNFWIDVVSKNRGGRISQSGLHSPFPLPVAGSKPNPTKCLNITLQTFRHDQ